MGVLTGHPFFCQLGRIELGANPLSDRGREELRSAMGDRVTFECEREEDWLYRIQDDDPFYNGIGPDGIQYVTRDGANGTEIASFDMAGNVLAVETRCYEAQCGDGSSDESFFGRASVQTGTVVVKRFTHADGRGIKGLPGLVRLFEARSPESAEELAFAHEVLEYWLHAGEFAFGNCILNRAGGVTGT